MHARDYPPCKYSRCAKFMCEVLSDQPDDSYPCVCKCPGFIPIPTNATLVLTREKATTLTKWLAKLPDNTARCDGCPYFRSDPSGRCDAFDVRVEFTLLSQEKFFAYVFEEIEPIWNPIRIKECIDKEIAIKKRILNLRKSRILGDLGVITTKQIELVKNRTLIHVDDEKIVYEEDLSTDNIETLTQTLFQDTAEQSEDQEL